MDRRKIGLSAENMAVGTLTEKGFQILERNFANRFGEIDIIAKDKDITGHLIRLTHYENVYM